MKAEGKIWVFYDVVTKQQTKPLSLLQAQSMLLQFRVKDLNKIYIWTPGWVEWKSLKSFLRSEQHYFAVAHPPRPQGQNIPSEAPSSHQNGPKQPLTSLVGTEKLFTRIEVNEKPKSKAKTDYGYWHNDFHGNELDISKINKIKPLEDSTKKEDQDDPSEITAVIDLDGDDRRASHRHNFKIEVVLINKQGSFRTFSKNISKTGTLLEDEIPRHYLKSSFDLVIINRFEPDFKKGRLLFKGKVVGDLSDPRRLTFIDVDDQMIEKLEVLLRTYINYQESLKKTS